MSDLVLRFTAWFATVPASSPAPDLGPGEVNVTPGWVGFTATFLMAVAAVALIFDMVRRIRRLSYREEIAAKLDAEQASEQPHDDAGTHAAPTAPRD